MRTLGIIALLLIVGVPTAIFFMLFGPNVFTPPLVYTVTVELDFVVDGRRVNATQQARCNVKDQRDSIAVGDFHTRIDYDNPFAFRGRNVMIAAGLDPCRWAGEASVVGRVYRLVADAEAEKWNPKGSEAQILGQLWVIDDSRMPANAQLLSLAKLLTSRGSIRLSSATLTVSDVPDEQTPGRSIREAIPFLAELAAQARTPLGGKTDRRALAERTIVTIRARLYRVPDGGQCHIPSSHPPAKGPWVGGLSVDCKGELVGSLPVTVNRDSDRIDIALDGEGTSVEGVAVFAGSVARAGRGGDNGRDSYHHWPAQFCIEGQCFEMTIGGYQEIMWFSDSDRRFQIEVWTEHFNVRDLETQT